VECYCLHAASTGSPVAVGYNDPLIAGLHQHGDHRLRECHFGWEESLRVWNRATKGGLGDDLVDHDLLIESILIDQRTKGMMVCEPYDIELREPTRCSLLARLGVRLVPPWVIPVRRLLSK
jgi:hypothetical protein